MLRITESVVAGAKTIPLNAAVEGIAVGDEVLIIDLQGTPSSFDDVGGWELALVASISGATIELTGRLGRDYDGALHKVILQRLPNYSDVTIEESGVLTSSPWNGERGGVLAFRSSGRARIAGSIHMTGRGYRRSTDIHASGEGTGGTNTGLGTEPAGEGGGRSCGQSESDQSAILNWGFDGTAGAWCATAYGPPDLQRASFGGGGGAGNQQYSVIAVPGGNGGGVIAIGAHDLEVSGSIQAEGTDGAGFTGAPPYDGSGGGGGGGAIYLAADKATITTLGRVSALGGLAGRGWQYFRNSTPQHRAGEGRIVIRHVTGFAGTTTPPALVIEVP